MIRAQLSRADLYDWIALRRVDDGGMARLGEWWLDWGRRMPGYVTDALAELCQREPVALRDPDPVAGSGSGGAYRCRNSPLRATTSATPDSATDVYTPAWR